MSGSQFSKDGETEWAKPRIQFFQIGTQVRRGLYNQTKLVHRRMLLISVMWEGGGRSSSMAALVQPVGLVGVADYEKTVW